MLARMKRDIGDTLMGMKASRVITTDSLTRRFGETVAVDGVLLWLGVRTFRRGELIARL